MINILLNAVSNDDLLLFQLEAKRHTSLSMLPANEV